MSKTLNIYDQKGAEAGSVKIDDKSIELEKGDNAVHQSVTAYLAGKRAGTASTKTRAQKRGGGAKPYRQKGLGRARSGSIRNPIWVGGGRIFGPKPRSFAQKLNKKTKNLALKRIFSEKIQENDVMVIDKIEFSDHKTKNAQTLLDSLKIENTALLIVENYDKNILTASRNIPGLTVVKVAAVNVYQMLSHDKIIFTKKVLDDFVQTISE